jgi:hypothetical protein
MNWLGKRWQSIDDHYHFSDGLLATTKRYETYGKMAKTYARLQDEAERVGATEFYVKIQIVGMQEGCIERIAELPATDRDRPSADRILIRPHPACRGREKHAALCEPGAAGAAARHGLRSTARTDAGNAGEYAKTDLSAPAKIRTSLADPVNNFNHSHGYQNAERCN